MVRSRNRHKVVGPEETGEGGGGCSECRGSGQNYYTLTEPTKAQNSTSKDGVQFIGKPPLYPAEENDSEIQTSVFLFV